MENLELHFVKYEPLKGGTWMPLPKEIEKKKAVVNPKNEDDFCFKYCLSLAYEMPKKRAERITKRVIRNTKRFKWDGLEFPLQVKDISKFEKLTPGISVNVFGYEKPNIGEAEIFPLRISKVDGVPVDLFLIADTGGMQHYCLVKKTFTTININCISAGDL